MDVRDLLQFTDKVHSSRTMNRVRVDTRYSYTVKDGGLSVRAAKTQTRLLFDIDTRLSDRAAKSHMWQCLKQNHKERENKCPSSFVPGHSTHHRFDCASLLHITIN